MFIITSIIRYVLRSAMPTNWDKRQSPSFKVSYRTEPRQTKGWRGKECDQAHAASQKQDKRLNLRLMGQVFSADTTFSQLLLLERQQFTKAIAYTAKAGHLPYTLEQLPAFEQHIERLWFDRQPALGGPSTGTNILHSDAAKYHDLKSTLLVQICSKSDCTGKLLCHPGTACPSMAGRRPLNK